MSHTYFSQRTGKNPNPNGLPLKDVINLFQGIFNQMREDGYFHQSLGYECVDSGYIDGSIRNIELEILLSIRKKFLWPIHLYSDKYKEDDLFDIIEFLFQHVSKPIDGTMHSYGNCGMHWHTFNKVDGQQYFREKINLMLGHYCNRFELSQKGEVLSVPEKGFEPIFEADIPTANEAVLSRIDAAILKYRRHGSTIDDRRQAVRDLADVLEYLRPMVKELLTSNDERDLFNIANNFEIRHLNDKQKSNYDKAIWLSWMFYFYLPTIHVVLRKIEADGKPNPPVGRES